MRLLLPLALVGCAAPGAADPAAAPPAAAPIVAAEGGPVADGNASPTLPPAALEDAATPDAGAAPDAPEPPDGAVCVASPNPSACPAGRGVFLCYVGDGGCPADATRPTVAIWDGGDVTVDSSAPDLAYCCL